MDIITHIPDLAAFRLECKAKAESGNQFFSIEDGVINYNVNKIPVVYSADYAQSVCLVRLITKEEINEFNSLLSCKRIGVCEDSTYIFDEGGEDVYNSIYDQTPKTFTDENGDEQTYTPPQMIGVFA